MKSLTLEIIEIILPKKGKPDGGGAIFIIFLPLTIIWDIGVFIYDRLRRLSNRAPRK